MDRNALVVAALDPHGYTDILIRHRRCRILRPAEDETPEQLTEVIESLTRVGAWAVQGRWPVITLVR